MFNIEHPMVDDKGGDENRKRHVQRDVAKPAIVDRREDQHGQRPRSRRRPGVANGRMRGRAMQGWLRVGSDHLRTKRELAKWVDIATTYARTLPAK